MAGDGGRVPDVSEQRAEVEAVAEAIRDTYVALGTRSGLFGSVGLLDERSRIRIAEVILDRVRDARGDDEVRVRIPPLCDRCGGDHYITEHDAPPARSPQDEDHECRDGKHEWAVSGDLATTCVRCGVPWASPSRDGTVAVEAWRAVALQLADVLRGLRPQNPYYREKQAEALAAFDALAGESNEGGNQNDERRHSRTPPAGAL